MEFVVKGVEATRENGGSEEHDGLPSVLREASARSLHSRPDDGFRGGFGDAGTDRVYGVKRGLRGSSFCPLPVAAACPVTIRGSRIADRGSRVAAGYPAEIAAGQPAAGRSITQRVTV